MDDSLSQFSSPTSYADGTPGKGGVVRSGSDANLFVEFYEQEVTNRYLTKKTGKKHSTKEVFVHIKKPGDKSDVRRKARPDDMRRFPGAFHAFKTQSPEEKYGTPIHTWQYLTTSQVQRLVFLGVKTVEQLSAFGDQDCYALGNEGLTMRKQAQQFVEEQRLAAAGASSDMLQQLTRERDEQQSMNQQLMERLAELEAKHGQKAGTVVAKKGKPVIKKEKENEEASS